MPNEKTEAEKLGEALKPRERQFVREYLRHNMNGTQAAICIGYSEGSAASQASRMLRKPDVRAYRDALLQEQFDAIGVTKHSIAAEVWGIYQKCMQKEPVMEWDSGTHSWVHTGEWTFNVKGALKALDMLNGMLPQMPKDDEGENYEDMVSGGGREF